MVKSASRGLKLAFATQILHPPTQSTQKSKHSILLTSQFELTRGEKKKEKKKKGMTPVFSSIQMMK